MAHAHGNVSARAIDPGDYMTHAHGQGTHAKRGRQSGRAEHAIVESETSEQAASNKHRVGWFTWFASTTAHLAGKPVVFFTAVAIIVIWAATGPLFGFSDTWQLIINTGTTIVTFLMVFLIQNTQNRDTLSLHIKLAELIIAMRGAHNKMATAEDLSDDDLQTLHDEYRKRAASALESLSERRAARGKQ